MKLTPKQFDEITTVSVSVYNELYKATEETLKGLYIAYPTFGAKIAQTALLQFYISTWMNTLPEGTTIKDAFNQLKKSTLTILNRLTPDDFYEVVDDEDKTSNRK